MMVFWLVAAVMLLIALAFVLPPLLQRDEKSNAAEVKEANVAVYRDQLRELESEMHNGIVSNQQYQQDRDEIERRLLDDVVTGDTTKPASSAALKRWGASLIAVGIGSFLLPLIGMQFQVINLFVNALGRNGL